MSSLENILMNNFVFAIGLHWRPTIDVRSLDAFAVYQPTWYATLLTFILINSKRELHSHITCVGNYALNLSWSRSIHSPLEAYRHVSPNDLSSFSLGTEQVSGGSRSMRSRLMASIRQSSPLHLQAMISANGCTVACTEGVEYCGRFRPPRRDKSQFRANSRVDERSFPLFVV